MSLQQYDFYCVVKLGVLVKKEFERRVVRRAESTGLRGAEPVEMRGAETAGEGGAELAEFRGAESAGVTRIEPAGEGGAEHVGKWGAEPAELMGLEFAAVNRKETIGVCVVEGAGVLHVKPTGVRCAGVRLGVVLVEAEADCDFSGSESEKSSSSREIHSAKDLLLKFSWHFFFCTFFLFIAIIKIISQSSVIRTTINGHFDYRNAFVESHTHFFQARVMHISRSGGLARAKWRRLSRRLGLAWPRNVRETF